MNLHFFIITWNCDEKWSIIKEYDFFMITEEEKTLDEVRQMSIDNVGGADGLIDIKEVIEISFEEFSKMEWQLSEEEEKLVKKYMEVIT